MDQSERTRLRALCKGIELPWSTADHYEEGSPTGAVDILCDGGDAIERAVEVARIDMGFGEECDTAHAALIVAAVNALPGLLDAADELRVLKAVRAARLQKMDEIVPQWRAACDAADSRAARAERERDDLAATLETRTAEHALAMERVRELEAIIAGRTTPPTDAEMRAHDVAGGSWLVWWGRESYTIAPAWLPYRRPGYGLKPWDLAQRWIALDAEGRPCAWPTAEVSRG